MAAPAGTTKIGNLAFDGCTGLTHVALLDGLTQIGAWAFRGCTGLTQVALPDGLTKIGDNAFNRDNTFNGCTGLTHHIIHDGRLVGLGRSADGNLLPLPVNFRYRREK